MFRVNIFQIILRNIELLMLIETISNVFMEI